MQCSNSEKDIHLNLALSQVEVRLSGRRIEDFLKVLLVPGYEIVELFFQLNKYLQFSDVARHTQASGPVLYGKSHSAA